MKIKSKKHQKIARGALPLLLLLLLLRNQYGVWPSAETRALRRQLAETTQVKISEIKLFSLEDLKRPQPPVFTLQGQEARDFAHSILIKRHESFSIFVNKEYNCEFYKGSKLLATLRFINPGNRMLLTWRESPNSGFITLYPHSSRHIERFFEEHNVAIAAK